MCCLFFDLRSIHVDLLDQGAHQWDEDWIHFIAEVLQNQLVLLGGTWRYCSLLRRHVFNWSGLYNERLAAPLEVRLTLKLT
jgi:hypothetical protein